MTKRDDLSGRSDSPRLSHVGADGEVRMVDVGDKPATERRATARGEIRMRRETLDLIRDNAVAKGDVLAAARIAGVMAAKRTSDLIPLCHPLILDDVRVDIDPDEELPGYVVSVSVRTTGRTGAEMEAMTAAAVTLLTIYDMAKAADREMVIGNIVLTGKSGGRSGEFSRLDGTSPAPYRGGER